MPIYAYKCSSCGHAKDVLQKISDAPLTVCPECGASTFAKQVTAAGFQLKGSGWYVTDFRNNGTGSGSAGGAKTESKADGGDSSGSAAKSADAAPAAASSTAPAPAAAPAAPPAAAS
ncbi:FmdB family zinc ribbon protein [Bordetella bronchialis]|uniref:FmdB family transcriptional regulator n=1 Tax=Bordetella bronchialis TaxID=463025 RepID=A0A193G2M9_9BORD|nr:FmdB family zinc ribbon protein [Bordetella bronchialis]ANN69113.1 FmdB family transcriptional regulator [Bordetella bronchialis]ANN74262.1 FmdB family transcriptional regulator [Bordetella bronchialis]